MQLERCPVDFYQNCKNRLRLCNICSAGNGKLTGKLLYNPVVESELLKHPHQEFLEDHRKTVKSEKVAIKSRRKESPNSRFTKRGLKNEDKIKNKIIQKTSKSGAIFGDGDFSILDSYFRADAKLRITGRSFGISSAEFEKGRAQGITTWVVTVEKQSETVVILTLDAYSNLLSLAERGIAAMQE
ncbi:hypothetical protein OsccyDRAFT_0747 [Leptolyngbyaceae cyanobacterium JSC-12]|nr:hypothetical protein OsccyDRAFT_0747 [Leptolyngbyaceae cyanobacterium JSC-12]